MSLLSLYYNASALNELTNLLLIRIIVATFALRKREA